MGNPIRDLRLTHQLSAPEMADVVRNIYPKFDRYLLSKCEASEVYGIQLMQDAKKALLLKYDPLMLKKKDNRKCPHRIQCRLDDETFKAFIAKSRADGFKTINDCLVDLIKAYTVRSDWDA